MKADTFPENTPHYVITAWSLRRETPASKTSKLSAAKIIHAAILLADQQGIEAVSIRSVAGQTGFSPMAIYRHIESRDELMILMVETALGTAPHFAKRMWQENVRDWANSLFAQYRKHPWTLDLPIIGIPSTPNHLSWVEQALCILEPTGLSPEERLNTALLIDGHIRQFARFGAPRSLKPTQPSDMSWLPEIASESAPALMRALQQGVMRTNGPDFAQGLEILIAGIAAYHDRS